MIAPSTPAGSGGPPPTGRGGHRGTGPRRDRFWLAALLGSAVLLVASLGWFVAGGPSSTATVAEPAVTAGSSAEPAVEATTEPSAESTADATARPAGRSVPTWSARPARPSTPTAEQAAPTGLSIPRLSLRIPIVPTTLERDGMMALPERPTELGWYAYGPTPGADRGSAVLGGHVDSRRYGIGPLVELRRLERGDTLVVSTARGRTTFVVTKVEQISKRALPVRELFRRDGPAELRVITCGGRYDPRSGGYQDNVVVTARPR